MALAYLSAGARDFVVVIDPGHGGKDAGCVGRSLKEKNIVLDIATRLDKLVSTLPECKTVLTRSNDRFVSLQGRADKANNAHGDLFISIHVNSVDEKTPARDKTRGIAVYTMGPDKSQRALQVAMRENAVMELEPDFTTKYRGFDPKSAESYISMEMTSDIYMKRSIDFARIVQKNLVKHTGRSDKGCHQAGFWVLWSPNMPSVLVELEFICNPDSEKWLGTDKARQQCAQALFESVKTYISVHRASSPDTDKPTAVSGNIKKNKKPASRRSSRAKRSDRKSLK